MESALNDSRFFMTSALPEVMTAGQGMDDSGAVTRFVYGKGRMEGKG